MPPPSREDSTVRLGASAEVMVLSPTELCVQVTIGDTEIASCDERSDRRPPGRLMPTPRRQSEGMRGHSVVNGGSFVYPMRNHGMTTDIFDQNDRHSGPKLDAVIAASTTTRSC